ncbi:MAG TPA: serine/threonine-protein kinase [Enhygromyxa sp.]|nr:serine/threonine-protein kinase [Enhygromyxa sp.]
MRDSERKYTITKPLGRGGMGQVWAALKHGDGGVQMPCAVKVLWPALALTEEDRERFYSEARIAAQLDHGRIVKVIDTTMVQGSPSLIMEWVDGVNLRVLLEKAREEDTPRLGLNVSLYIVGEILAALAYAHSRTVAGENAAVIHSDVTPGNILISSSGEVKLTDFGIARFVRMSDKTMSRAIGTPRYMAAEQMRGRIYTATDIYGLGVVLHELLEGERYLYECASEEFQFRVLGGKVPDLTQPGIPDWVDALRRRMLSVDPEKRPAAEDAHAMIVEMSSNYALAGLELKRLYLRVVGNASSGFTELLRIRHGGDAGTFFASVFGQGSSSNPAAAADASGAATRDEVPVDADSDAPAVLRRPGRTPNSGTRETIERTNTGGAAWTQDDDPVVDRTVRLPVHELQPAAPAAVGADVTPAPVEAATLDLEQRTPTIVDAVASGDATDESPAIVGARQHGGAWVRFVIMAAGAAAFLSAGIFIASVAMTWADDEQPELAQADQVVEPQITATGAEPATATDPEPAPKPDPPPEPELEPELEPTPKLVDAPVEPSDSVPLDDTREPEPEPEEVEVKSKPKPETKPKLEPPVKVTFNILATAPGKSKAAEIKAGSKRITTDNGFKSTELRPGTHKIQWRWKDGSWHQAGTLRVESGLPKGSYYSVKLWTDELDPIKTLGSGK